ncbi:MAG: uroporphyrinogen decarboxylase [Kiritimatiellae bacterium]|jgi:uroporphyrinogen decarboxylase|nr:uroporphyrinogen decarboxylase [Kiritimatiellia bacterium]
MQHTTSENDTFLKACRGEPVPFTPVWLMRQAGRYMPEYRAIREHKPILDMMKNPELAAEVTLQPVEAFDVDAAIIFADILTLLEAMGLNLEFIPGRGPVFHNPIRSRSDVNALSTLNASRDLSFTLEAIHISRERLRNRIPLIGFSGAPFTLACYAVAGGGSKDFDEVRAWMFANSSAWVELMDRLTDGIIDYLHAQLDAGAQAFQLFDSWAGCLSVRDYARFAAPWTRKIFASLQGRSPGIHFSANGGHLLEQVAEMPVDVIGLDWRVDPASVMHRIGSDRVYQGNLDPARLLASDEATLEGAAEVLNAFAPAKGHIFNLGHGVVKTTPPERVKKLIDEVHRLSRVTVHD